MERSTLVTASQFQSEANGIENAIQQVLLNSVNTLITGIVDHVNDDGTYDVQPTLNYLLKNQSPVKPPLLPNLPAAKIRFSNAGIKGKYKKGDAVIIGIVQRDISILKKAWKRLTNPASLRRFALPDGIILNGLANDDPSVFIELSDEKINIVAPEVIINAPTTTITTTTASIKASSVTIESPTTAIKSANISMTGAVTVGGGLSVTGGVTIDGAPYAGHNHSAGTYQASVPVTGQSGSVV